MHQLEITTPHFIRCIKPNSNQLPGMYEMDLVLQQLRCCGVLEVVRISRSGYPTRMRHQEFAERWIEAELKMLFCSSIIMFIGTFKLCYLMVFLSFRYGFLLLETNVSQDPLSISIAILQQFNILPEMYQIGYTKVYLRTGQVRYLLLKFHFCLICPCSLVVLN